MPLQKLQFRPGINREGTNYSNEGGWYDCDKVRFRSGFPQKLGGWVQATGNRTYDGVCRMMINWADLSNNNLLGIGTHLKYYINNNLTDYNNITPLRKTTNPMGNNPFAATNGSTTVVVTDTNGNKTSGGNNSGGTTVNSPTGGTMNNQLALLLAISDANRNATIASKPPVTLEEAINLAAKDPNIVAKYGDALALDKEAFTQSLNDLSTKLKTDTELEKTQFENDRKALAAAHAAAGSAYSGFSFLIISVVFLASVSFCSASALPTSVEVESSIAANNRVCRKFFNS